MSFRLLNRLTGKVSTAKIAKDRLLWCAIVDMPLNRQRVISVPFRLLRHLPNWQWERR